MADRQRSGFFIHGSLTTWRIAWRGGQPHADTGNPHSPEAANLDWNTPPIWPKYSGIKSLLVSIFESNAWFPRLQPRHSHLKIQWNPATTVQ